MSQKYNATQYAPPNGGIVNCQLPNTAVIGYFAGTPTASISGYHPGALAFDITNGIWYRNSGTTSSATWVATSGATVTAMTITTLTTSNISGGGSTIALTDRMTTTDGVASGTAKVIGGLASNSVAASTAVTSTATETAFDTLYAIPANTLKAGTMIKVRWAGIITAANGTDTGTFKLYLATNTTAGSLAGIAFTTTTATDMTANDIVTGEAVVTVRTAGSSGTLVAVSNHTKVEAASNTATVVSVLTNSTAVNTQTVQTVAVSCTFNSTNAGNSARLDILGVEIY